MLQCANDFVSDPILLMQGMKQGDALSPMHVRSEQPVTSRAFSFLGRAAYSSKFARLPMIPRPLLKTLTRFHSLSVIQGLNLTDGEDGGLVAGCLARQARPAARPHVVNKH